MRPFPIAGPLALLVVLASPAALSDDAPTEGAKPADAPSDAAAVVAAAHARHADLVAKGLRSFKARVTLRPIGFPEFDIVRDACSFTYEFEAPSRETFDFKDCFRELAGPTRSMFLGLWREVTGALWFREMEGADRLRIVSSTAEPFVAGTTQATGAFEAVVRTPGGPLVSLKSAADRRTRTWTCDETPDGFRVRRREAAPNWNLAPATTFDAFREVQHLTLPTVVGFEPGGKRAEYALEYLSVNGKPARAAAPDPAGAPAAVRAFEGGWKTLEAVAKVRRLCDVANFESDLASASIAGIALTDASPAVREAAAETLGLMRRSNVVPALVAALGPDEKESRVRLATIYALGEIGDARAVDALSTNWRKNTAPPWDGLFGPDEGPAKIHALGKIRDAKSVDVLIDALRRVPDDRLLMVEFGPWLFDSLRRLTGQKLGDDRRAWEEWWKRNRATYRF